MRSVRPHCEFRLHPRSWSEAVREMREPRYPANLTAVGRGAQTVRRGSDPHLCSHSGPATGPIQGFQKTNLDTAELLIGIWLYTGRGIFVNQDLSLSFIRAYTHGPLFQQLRTAMRQRCTRHRSNRLPSSPTAVTDGLSMCQFTSRCLALVRLLLLVNQGCL